MGCFACEMFGPLDVIRRTQCDLFATIWLQLLDFGTCAYSAHLTFHRAAAGYVLFGELGVVSLAMQERLPTKRIFAVLPCLDGSRLLDASPCVSLTHYQLASIASEASRINPTNANANMSFHTNKEVTFDYNRAEKNGAQMCDGTSNTL